MMDLSKNYAILTCMRSHQFVLDWTWAEYKQGHSDKAAAILLRESERFPNSEAVGYDLAVVLASAGPDIRGAEMALEGV